MAFSKDDFTKLVRSAVANGVSDIHLRTNEKPCFRMRGDLIPIKTNPLSYDDIKLIAKIFL